MDVVVLGWSIRVIITLPQPLIIQSHRMYFHKEQISNKITQISQQRHTHNKTFLSLQSLLTDNKKYEISQLRTKFTSLIEDLNKVIKDNINVLDLLQYRVEKAVKEGDQGMGNFRIRVESLREYFGELRDKVRRESQRGEELITSRERWELTKYKSSNATAQEEQKSLLTSHSTAKQTTEIARSVLENLSNQSSRLEKAREQMGGIIKSINFSGNLAQLMRTRTREDNRLIAMLSLGLVLWIFVCVFVLKPLYRGT